MKFCCLCKVSAYDGVCNLALIAERSTWFGSRGVNCVLRIGVPVGLSTLIQVLCTAYD